MAKPFRRAPLWPAAWLSAVDMSRSSKSPEVQRVWEVCCDQLLNMAVPDALRLEDSLREDDVSGT